MENLNVIGKLYQFDILTMVTAFSLDLHLAFVITQAPAMQWTQPAHPACWQWIMPSRTFAVVSVTRPLLEVPTSAWSPTPPCNFSSWECSPLMEPASPLMSQVCMYCRKNTSKDARPLIPWICTGRKELEMLQGLPRLQVCWEQGTSSEWRLVIPCSY